MPFFGRTIESLVEQDLQRLIDDEVTESKDIDYKEALTIATGDEKKEFLADLTSFANTAGGHLLVGIKADGNRPASLPGLEMTSTEQDRAKQQIENLARDTLDPRLPPLQMHFIPLQSGRHVLAIRIVQSWAAPHMVKTSAKFFARNSSGKFHLDTQQLRAAFTATEDLGRRMSAWKTERIGRILAQEGPVPVIEGAKFIAHLLPQESFVPGAAFEVLRLRDLRVLSSTTGSQARPSLEGVESHVLTRDETPSKGYMHVYRNGCVECVDTICLEPRRPELQRLLMSDWIEGNMIQFVQHSQGMLHSIGVGYPMFACLTLVGVKGFRLTLDSQMSQPSMSRLRGDVMNLPETMLLARDEDVGAKLRPAFDVMWNAFGYPGSQHYDERGLRRQR